MAIKEDLELGMGMGKKQGNTLPYVKVSVTHERNGELNYIQ